MGDVGVSVPIGRLPKALIVSEVMLFRDGLRSGLARIGSLDVVASSAPEHALAIIGTKSIDIVILDASRSCALNHAAELRAAWPELKLVAFGICSYRDMLAGAEFGICAFVGEDGEIADINRLR